MMTMNLDSYIGQRVQVYRNLHKGAFSVRVKGLVVGYCDSARLAGCEFKVGEVARQRVLERKCRSVHAYVVGTLVSAQNGEQEAADFFRVSYNPFVRGDFFNKATGAAITLAGEVVVRDNQCFAK